MENVIIFLVSKIAIFLLAMKGKKSTSTIYKTKTLKKLL